MRGLRREPAPIARLALLNEASGINSSLDTDEILQSLLAQMNELLNAEAISIALVRSAAG